MRTLVLSFLLFFGQIELAHSNFKKAENIFNKSSEDKESQFEIFKELFQSKYYFSSVPFAAEYIIQSKNLNAEFEKMLEILILKTGTSTFAGIAINDLKKHDSPSISLILGLNYFRAKEYLLAINSLKNIKLNHRFSPEARMVEGSAYNLINSYSNALVSYDQCIDSAEGHEDKSANEKLQRYFAVLRESCLVHKARILFKQKDFEGAIRLYEKIPKTSYSWPYLLLEKAWSYYYQEDYNRSLGLLTTYRSPLLKSYFFPESEVLTALSYFRLCLYDDTLQTIEQYYTIYKNRSDHLKNILMQHKDSHTFFLKLMFSSLDKVDDKNPYFRNLITQIRKKVKFSVDLVTRKKAVHELKSLRALQAKKNSEFISFLIKEVKHSISWRGKALNHFVKKEMFNFINDIHRFSFEMFNIKLEIMSRKRDLIYKNKKLIADRSRGDLENVKRNDKQFFWLFQGAFWADELGDYSFGLKSNCEVKKEQ